MKIHFSQEPNKVVEAFELRLRQVYLELCGDNAQRLKAFFPAGSSPKRFYERIRENSEFWQEKLMPFQIDEFRLSGGVFRRELEQELVGPLGIYAPWWKFIDDKWGDLDFAKHIGQTQKIGVDISILGLGVNGHVGFHEPGISENFIGGAVEITKESQMRVSSDLSQNVFTFGTGFFLKTKYIFMLVMGPAKRQIFEKLLLVDGLFPAQFLKQHKNFEVFTDLVEPLKKIIKPGDEGREALAGVKTLFI